MGTLKGSLVMFGKRTKVLQWREGPSTVDAQHLDTHKRFIRQEQQHTSVVPVVQGLMWEDGMLSLPLQDLHSRSIPLKYV